MAVRLRSRQGSRLLRSRQGSRLFRGRQGSRLFRGRQGSRLFRGRQRDLFGSRQGGRRVDLVLGLLLLTGVGTGVAANTIGVDWPLNLISIHAAAGLAILLVAPWKWAVVRRGLRRTRRRRSVKGL